MPKSLKCKLSSLRYKRLLTDEEYKELIQKLEGHDREIRNAAIDDFVTRAHRRLGCSEKDLYCSEVIDEIAEQMKKERIIWGI